MWKIFSVAFIALQIGSGCHDPNDDRYLVLTTAGGLANRLRALASAAVVAKATNRKLILDWPATVGEVPAQFNELFANDIATSLPSTLPSGCQIAGLKQDANSRNCDLASFYDVPADVEEIVKSFYHGKFSQMTRDSAKILYINTYYNFMPESLTFDEYLTEYTSFYRSLKPIDEVTTLLNKFLSDNQLQSTKDVVGIHFRSWVLSQDAGRNTKTSYELYRDTMKDLIAKDGAIKFYVAADDVAVIERMKADLGAQRILHYPITKVDRNTVKAQQEALLDWLILGKTKYIYGTNQSSFSDEAALLTGDKRKINLGPKAWPFHSMICFDKDTGKPYKRPDMVDAGC